MFFYQCHREQASSVGSPSGRPGGKSPSIIFILFIHSVPDPGCLLFISDPYFFPFQFPDLGFQIEITKKRMKKIINCLAFFVAINFSK